MAVGNAGIAALDISKVAIWIGAVKVIDGGRRAEAYKEEDGAREMRGEEIPIRITLGRGAAETTVWTCDYSYDYVKINSEYRT